MGAAAHGFSCVWRCMNVQKKQYLFLRPRHHLTAQSRISSSIFKSHCCTFSSSSGPVRYIPKHRRLQPDNQTDNLTRPRPNPADYLDKDTLEPSGSCLEPRRLGAVDRDCTVLFGKANDGDLLIGPDKAPVQKTNGGAQLTANKTRRKKEETTQSLVQENNRDDHFTANRTLRTRDKTVKMLQENSREAHSTVRGNFRKRVQTKQTDNLPYLFKGDSIEVVQSFMERAQKNLELQKNTINTNESADPCFLEGIDSTNGLDEELGNLDEFGLGALVDETPGVAHDSNLGAVIGLRDAVAASTASQESAKNLAIRYLAMRPYTAFQLRKKLQGCNVLPELVDYALSTVQKCGLQSDLAYAETFTRARWKSGSWGPQRIRLGLKQRGVSDDIVSRVIDVVFYEDENELSGTKPTLEDDGSELDMLDVEAFGMSKSTLNHLILKASKQWDRGRNATNETKVRRMIYWLKYRGFRDRVIRTVLNTLLQRARSQD